MVESDHANYIFSTKGACLEQLIFKRVMSGKLEELPEQFKHHKNYDRETDAFWWRLIKHTPYTYTLVSQKQLESATQLVYKAETKSGSYRKDFYGS